MHERPLLGVSACLLGHPVRFDGGHKRQRFITDTLARHFDLRPVCPEAEIGLGVPRPTIQLRRTAGGGEVRLINPRADGADLTDTMRRYAERRVAGMEDLAGFILKKDSPSCGMERVPVVVNADGFRSRDGVGIFARALMEQWPLLPIEEEGRLNDPAIRENFLERVYALQRWREIPDAARNVEGFIRFHARHKFMLMARGAAHYQALGRLVSGTTRATLERNRTEYIQRFMAIMAIRPDKGRQVNVLQHLLGYFKRVLDGEDKQELLTLFERYRRDEVPLVTPVTLLRHHLRRAPNGYLADQYYLAPYPESLALRSYI